MYYKYRQYGELTIILTTCWKGAHRCLTTWAMGLGIAKISTKWPPPVILDTRKSISSIS